MHVDRGLIYLNECGFTLDILDTSSPFTFRFGNDEFARTSLNGHVRIKIFVVFTSNDFAFFRSIVKL